MEPWEALDLDDSDLPSLLRPCKRQSQHIFETQLCDSSPIPASQSFSSKPPPSVSPNGNFLPQNMPLSQPPPPLPLPSALQPLPVEASMPHLIPGSAGAIQVAMHRRNGEHHGFSHGKDVQISTQDYIKRVEEDQSREFMNGPWLSALYYIDQEGMNRTPLGAIKKFVNAGKIDKVVAMIKSCSPNGLGDMMVLLKDPTDTIGASIHRKVLNEGEFGREISVGSVLVLQKVAVFSPSPASYYLNITLGNVVKCYSWPRNVAFLSRTYNQTSYDTRP
ncbi:hypothetical protein Ancab_009740 [Ancistrocladus abbreviatus]